MKKTRYVLILLTSLTTACSHFTKDYSPEEVKAESSALNNFFKDEFDKNLMRSPSFITYLGGRQRYGELDDISYEHALEDLALAKNSLKTLKKFRYEALNPQSQISYELYKKRAEDQIKYFKYFYHRFFVTQMFGQHSQLPTFMINMHQIANEQEAKDYISRLNAFNRRFDQLIVLLKKQESLGIKMPQFVFDRVIRDSQNIISHFPFNKSKKDSTLYADFKNKIKGLNLSPVTKKELRLQAQTALLNSVKPAYTKFITYMKYLKKKSPHNHGIWSIPQGKEVYKRNLARATSTEMTAPEVHQLGLKEVARIHQEMKQTLKKVNFQGSFSDFFKFIKDDPRFTYPNTKQGRQDYLKRTKTIISNMKGKLDQLFITQPKADLIVKPVEAFREKSAGIAFYKGPSPDGKRPGIYYVNLSDMSSVAKYDMEALAYHEGVPGHHMQIAISTELQNIPRFRKFGRYLAYVEGWGLYSEFLPKEVGFYQDPYSDFGRLSMELWRACRLVIDTGLHHYKWSREKSIDYLSKNTPFARDKIVKEVERYIVMPGRDTAYKIGQLKILELRMKAKNQLKTKFDIREFHDIILRNGPLPLDLLEKQIDLYIKSKS